MYVLLSNVLKAFPYLGWIIQSLQTSTVSANWFPIFPLLVVWKLSKTELFSLWYKKFQSVYSGWSPFWNLWETLLQCTRESSFWNEQNLSHMYKKNFIKCRGPPWSGCNMFVCVFSQEKGKRLLVKFLYFKWERCCDLEDWVGREWASSERSMMIFHI